MVKKLEDLKVAIITDWMTSRGGAERVNLVLARIFPQADIYTSVYKPEAFPELTSRNVITSYLQRWPLHSKHQLFAPFRPKAFESFNLDDYDLVISSSTAESKGVITKPETVHICYCHTPIRYYWSHYHDYLKEKQLGPLDPLVKMVMPGMVHQLRMWDRVAADRVDFFVSNSNYIKQRIKKYYEADATTIYPPVNFSRFQSADSTAGDYYVVLGRQVAYKRADLVVEAFNQLDKPLKVIGGGPELGKLRQLATSPKIEILGELSDQEVTKQLAGAKALIFPQEEDFGIVPLEAMAAGKPVIAFGKGGALETVIDGQTGVHFKEQTASSLVDAIHRFETLTILPDACRTQAQRFDEAVFERELKEFVQKSLEQYHEKLNQ